MTGLNLSHLPFLQSVQHIEVYIILLLWPSFLLSPVNEVATHAQPVRPSFLTREGKKSFPPSRPSLRETLRPTDSSLSLPLRRDHDGQIDIGISQGAM